MTRLLAAYLSGVSSCAAFVFAAGGRAAFIGFSLGVCFILAALAIALGSAPRILGAARFLADLAQAIEGTTAHGRLVEMPRQAPAIVAELASALENMGDRPKVAAAKAREAFEKNPAGDFDTLFRACVRRAA